MGALLLDSINQPRDLKQLNEQQVKQLCAEIRQFLLENISKTGGHLASNLGVVELTVALHRVLDTPQDKIVFDVGHQCYTHKILTGRRGQFDKLRQLDGISGFPDPNESEHDAFIAGHGNTALSLAIGMAWAKKLHHEAGLVVAVIGDGAFTGGMVYEGMNNIEQLDNLLVILNDNKMSISKNVGALARYLTHLRTTTAYFDAKDNVRSFLDGVPLVGAPLKKNITECKTLLRRAMYHSTMFEDMGFQYIGPVDGHNVEELERTLRTIRNRQGPHFLHVITKKGKGYQPAEVNPGNYHGVSAFDPDGMPDPEVAPKESFSTVFGNALVTEGNRNPNICAITAAMKYGTGLQFFAHSHPERFFDVGMAEQHAVTFAAGLASQGMIPVFAVYSSFLQRAVDQILHDVCMQNLPVVFAVDRAGLVGSDGETHHGCFDLSYLSMMPNMTVLAPKNDRELEEMLAFAVSFDGPIAIRYPRGSAHQGLREYQAPVEYGRSEIIRKGKKIAVLGVGSMIPSCMEICKGLKDDGYDPTFVNARFVKPLDVDLLDELAKDHSLFVTVEENVKSGGYGERVSAYMEACHPEIRVLSAAVWDRFVPQGNVESLRSRIGLGVEDIRQAIEDSEELREQ